MDADKALYNAKSISQLQFRMIRKHDRYTNLKQNGFICTFTKGFIGTFIYADYISKHIKQILSILVDAIFKLVSIYLYITKYADLILFNFVRLD